METHFKSNLQALLKSFVASSSLAGADVTLVCKDGRVSTHSLLLAAASPLLKQAMLSCPADIEMFTVCLPWSSVNQIQNTLCRVVGSNSEFKEDGNICEVLESLGIDLSDNFIQGRSKLKKENTTTCDGNGHYYRFDNDNNNEAFDSSIPDDDNDVRIPKVKLEVVTDPVKKETPSQYQSDKDKVENKCEVCCNVFLDFDSFKQHISGQECNKNKQTPAMLKASKAANELIREIDKDGRKVFGCINCDYTNDLRYKTVRHCFKHTKIFPYQCELCDEMFRDDRACKEHVTRDHDGVKQYSCDQCATKFTCKTSLQSHLKRHAIPSDIFKCEIVGCNFSTNLKGTLQKHVERRHTAENKTHLCNSCGKTFFDKVDLARHEESIHVVPHLQCGFCPKLYPTERHRTAHESRVHSTELRFQCDECPMGYRHPSSLQKHILSAHRGEDAKRFKCSQCAKGFITNGKLMAHERIHTGEKRYACPYCGLRFTDSSAMSRHKKIHEGGNKYTCDICGKTYSQSYDVVKHKTTVHGIVPTKQWGHHYKGESNSSVKQNEIEKDETVDIPQAVQ